MQYKTKICFSISLILPRKNETCTWNKNLKYKHVMNAYTLYTNQYLA